MNQTRFSREIARAFTRPFSRAGLSRLLFTVIGLLLPVVGYVAQGAAWSLAAGRRDGWRGWIRLGWRIFLAETLLAAPAFLVYALILLIGTWVTDMTGIAHLLLMFALVWAGVRIVVLTPAASCCLAHGAPLRVAADAKEMKRVISGCMKQYLPACLFSFAMLFVIGVLTNGMRLVPRLLIGGVLAGLHTVFTAGLFTAACRRALGLPPVSDGPDAPAPGGFGPGARRAVAMLLALTLLAAVPLRAFAIRPEDVDIQPRPPGKDETLPYDTRTYVEAYNDFARQGLMGYGKFLSRDALTGQFYIWEDVEKQKEMDARSQKLMDKTITVADVATDFIPGIGNAKNVVQTIYYGYRAYNETDPEAKRDYTVKAAYKGVSVGLAGLTRVLDGAAGASWKVAQKMLNKGRSLDQISGKLALVKQLDQGVKNLQKLQDLQDVYEKANNALALRDVVTDEGYSDWTGPEGLVKLTVIGHDTVKWISQDPSARIKLTKENLRELTEHLGDRGKALRDTLFQKPVLRFTPIPTNPWPLNDRWDLENWFRGDAPPPQPGEREWGDEDPAWLLDQTTPTPTPAPGGTPAPSATPAPGNTPAPSAAPTPGNTPAPSATPKPKPDPTPSGKASLSAEAFLGAWVDSEGSRMILMASGGNIIVKEPDLSWYGGDVLCTEYRAEYDEDTGTLYLYGLTSWVVGPELLDAASYAERPLEIDASLISMELTAAEVKDGVVTKLYDGWETYTRG